MKTLKFFITSEYEQVSNVCLSMKRACFEYLNMSEIKFSGFELAIAEVLNNVIEHAYGERSGNKIDIILILNTNYIEAHVFDDGKLVPVDLLSRINPYSPTSNDTDDETSDLDSIDELMKESGKGLRIIKSVMDEVTYSRVNGQNCMAMKLLL